MRSYEFWGENWVTNRGKIGVKTGKKKGKFWENRNDNQVKTSPVILDTPFPLSYSTEGRVSQASTRAFAILARISFYYYRIPANCPSSPR